jgi:division protein CdvB (Snf7/Vps24/ESCRT-III family)
MGKMNKQMDAQEVMKVMGEFSKQNEMMGMKEEMMDDTIDSIFDDDADEADEAVDQIYDELGLQFGNKMSSVGGKSKLPSANEIWRQKTTKIQTICYADLVPSNK